MASCDPEAVARRWAAIGRPLGLPRDGTVMALGASTLPLDEKFGNPGVRFKAAELSWIGRIAARVDILMMWKDSPVKTIGTKFKIVRGYEGPRALTAIHPDWVKDKTVNIIVQFALQRDPHLPDVPAAAELGRTADQTAILKAIMRSTEMGLALFSTPGVPPDRLTALRRAFDATMKDPDFQAVLKTAGGEVSPLTGERLQQAVSELTDLPPDLTAKAKAAYLDVK